MSRLHILILLASVTAVLSWYPLEYAVPGEQSYHGVHDGLEHAKSFSNEWIVHVEGGDEVAELVALELGYVYGGPVIGFPNTYAFIKYGHSKQRRTPSTHTTTLVKDRRVRWAEQLFSKFRVKRYPMPGLDEELHRVKRYPMPSLDEELHRVKRIEQIGQNNATDTDGKREKKSFVGRTKPLFNDELWSHEWYLQDTRTSRNLPRLDLNVLPVYKMGYNGRGVRVSVLDDGIEHNHTDLRENYDPGISWDCNDRDSDPAPRYEKKMRNSHGTRCAGEIAMTANNGKCGVGVAWGAKVGGVRMLDGRITDRIEGEAIGYAWDKVDVYSSSWGPNDDGSTVEGPGRLAIEALERGITQGRGGKGTIYVWANGNGGGHHDNCNCDGYSSSIYTISIGSASQHGLFPWYGEICSSTLAVAYSSGAYKDQKIATTDTSDSCTLGHTGTSAAAPLAAGIVALALQANPNLTWRDVQHLIVWTSEYAPLSANSGWQKNGVGLRFDIRFGFGLLNAGALVTAALNWTTVPDKHECRIEATPSGAKEGRISSEDSIIEVAIKVQDCPVNYIEHVQLIINARYTRRGALEIQMGSPQGTKVQLLSPRPLDQSNAGFLNWPLMSVATWGEKANGIWTITFEDKTNEINSGVIGQMNLVIHGTSEQPAHMRDAPRKYDNSIYEETLRYFENVDDKHDVNIFSEDFIPETVFIDQEEEIRGASGTDRGGIDRIEELLRDDWEWSGLASKMNSAIGKGTTETIGGEQDLEPTLLDAVERVLERIRHR